MAHGQPSDAAPPEDALARLAGQVARHLPGWHVRSATLAMPGRLEEAAGTLVGNALVYPVFMAAGHFVTGVLPRRLGPGRFRQLPPLGLEPGLPHVAARMVRCDRNAPRRLLLAAHGSRRGRAAAEAALGFARALGPLLPDTHISVGFVEQSPTIADAARGLDAGALCLPFLALPGGHYRRDVPQALDEAGFAGALLSALGLNPDIPALIARSLKTYGQETEAA